jgi:hypothetical protein
MTSQLGSTSASQPQEATLYQSPSVQVTTARLIIGPKTYAMANITSVTIVQEAPDTSGPIWLSVGGLGAVVLACCPGALALGLFSGPSEDYGTGAICILTAAGMGLAGLLALTGAIALGRSLKPTFLVRIGSASGEVSVLADKNRELVECIVRAINEAIVRRG